MPAQSCRRPERSSAPAEVAPGAAVDASSNADANASLAAAQGQGLLSDGEGESVLDRFAASEGVVPGEASRGAGVGAGVVAAAEALDAALDTGDDAEILAALAAVDAALDVAEQAGDEEAITEATAITYLARGRKTEGTKKAYDEVLFRMSRLREARKASAAEGPATHAAYRPRAVLLDLEPGVLD